MKAREIAEFVNGVLHGDGDVDITRIADIRTAGTGDIAFVEDPDGTHSTNASCIFVPLTADIDRFGPIPNISVQNPKLAFARIAAKLHPREKLNYRHETARIHEGSKVRASYIGAFASVGEGSSVRENAEIHDGVSIGRNVHIGQDTIIYPNAVVYDNVRIGNGCVIHAGVVIGADGFGFVKTENGGYQKFPQIGTVVIEDFVELGANTCVDRGALGETRIGEGTKIDNLVQVGHNVQIGKRVVIAAQTGISGSTIIEDDCVIGGQVGFGDHAHVKSGAVIGSQAGVLPGKIVRPGIWWGTPIQPLEEFKRMHAHVKSIERLKAEVRELKRRLGNKA